MVSHEFTLEVGSNLDGMLDSNILNIIVCCIRYLQKSHKTIIIQQDLIIKYNIYLFFVDCSSDLKISVVKFPNIHTVQ